MIVYRYIAREVLASMTAVTGVLLFILISGRFVKYLAQVAEGELAADVLFSVIAYRVPGFLELLLPLGLFLGILLGFGRMYLESEMVVLQASGFSQFRLIKYAYGPGLLVAMMVAGMSLWLAPWSAEQSRIIYDQQKARSELDTVLVGRFQRHEGEVDRVSYVESISPRGELQDVFVFNSADNGVVLTRAEKGNRELLNDGQSAYFIMKSGKSFQGNPGELNFQVSSFAEYGFQLKDPNIQAGVSKLSALSTETLWNSSIPRERAQLHWRLSLPALVLIVTLLAVPLSRVNPRQGRYAKLLPAIVLYLVYISAMSFVRSESEEGELPVAAIWAVHGVALLLPLNLVFAGRFWSDVFNRMPSLSVGRKK